MILSIRKLREWCEEDGGRHPLGESWEIEVSRKDCDTSILHSMCWDEMLGAWSRIALGSAFPRNASQQEPHRVSEVRLEIVCEQVNGSYWLLSKTDGRFTGVLTYCEALGFIAKYTLTGEVLWGGFRTYAEHVARCKWLQREPRALLENCA